MGDSDMFGQSIQSKQHYFLLGILYLLLMVFLLVYGFLFYAWNQTLDTHRSLVFLMGTRKWRIWVLILLCSVGAAYQPSMELLIRRLVAQEERPQIEWPRSYQRFRLDRAVKKEMISSWLAAMVASVSRSVSPASLAQDIVTPLLSILSPPTLRPVSH